VLAQYVKDLSFENPGIFAANPSNAAPEIELGIDVRVEPGPPDQSIFSVELKLSARAKRQDAVVFIDRLALCVAGNDSHWLREFADPTATGVDTPQ